MTTCLVAGSMLAISIVSVRAWSRPWPESMPVNRMLIREDGVGGVTSGVPAKSTLLSLGDADPEALGSGDPDPSSAVSASA